MIQQTNAQEESENADVSLENLGTVNTNEVVIQKGNRSLTLTFSYKTIVNFRYLSPIEYNHETIKNLWSTTTGKLLNRVCPNHDERLEEDEFKKRLSQAMRKVFLTPLELAEQNI